MTKHLLERLKAECREMEHELKSVLPQEIGRAAALGDLSENAEYEAALDRQRLLQSKFRTLKARISEISTIDVNRIPPDKAGYGSIVTVLDLNTDAEITYQLVMPEDAEAAKSRISVSSPIGRALIGRAEGDEVTITIPSGVKNYEILTVIPYRDTDQDL